MTCDAKKACMIFVDDSNVWIEAQKFAASGKGRLPKLEDRDRDPRFRVDIGQLVRTISKDRSVEDAFLYGSRPPPNDSVWSTYERFGFKVNIYDRANNGKEKQVDNSMATDISREATELRIGARYNEKVKQRLANMTFIVISGDRDMLPPIAEAQGCNIQVEVWAWESGISNEHKMRDGGSLRVCYLDQIADRIFFTNTRSTRKGRKVEPDKTVVLCDPEDKDNETDLLEASVSDLLLVECSFIFYITRSQKESELFVEFPNLKNVENMILKLRRLFKGAWTVESWPEYASRRNEQTPVTLEKGNMYWPLCEKSAETSASLTTEDQVKAVVAQAPHSAEWDPPDPVAEQSLNDKDDLEVDDSWETVKSRSNPGAAHRRTMQQARDCPYGLHCRKAATCTYRHTPEEESLFRDFPNQNFTKWKTAECRYHQYCRKGKRCPYAHSAADAWCPKCRKGGHYDKDCQFGTWPQS